MKSFKRIILLMLVLTLALCACEQAVEEVVPEYEGAAEGVDLEGFNATWGWKGAEGSSVFGFIPDTENADFALQRKSDVEKALNCKIKLAYSSSLLDNFRAGILAGYQDYDIIAADGNLMPDVRAGYLTGLSQYLDVTNTDKWGTPNMLQQMLWEKDLFGVVPFAWPDLIYRLSGHILAVNENLITILAQTDPREYVENNEWTWDKFEEVLADYTYTEGDRTVYGVRVHLPYYAINMFLSSGVAISSYQDGHVVAGVYTEVGREALERAQKIYYETCSDYFHPLTDSVGDDEFVNGEAVMYLTWMNELTGNTRWIMYNMDNVGVLPFPQGPHATPGKYLSYHENLLLVFGIPFNAKDPAVSAQIMDAMCEPFEKYKTKEDIIDYMASQIFFDRRDAEVVVNEVMNTEYGFYSEGARIVLEGVGQTNTPVSRILESNQSRYDTIVEEYMIPCYEARIAVYGE
jgi:ABC-type glycerol-3-phosphate transport system substrate-binding protein